MPAVAEPGPHFEFVLYPNPPLAPAGVMALMLAVTAVSLAVSVGFMAIGAWPVTGFFGLDLVALFLAFRWVRRQSRRMELIRIDRDGLVVRRVSPSGEAAEQRLEPFWARVELDRVRGNNARLCLTSHGRSFEVGRFLSLPEKRELHRALSEALAALRA